MILRIYLGSLLTVLCNCIQWSRVPDMDGKQIQTNGKDLQCNKLACAIECSKNSRCLSFSHDAITNRCVLYDDVITTGIDDASSKWRYYKSTARPKTNVPCPSGYYKFPEICFTVYEEGGLGLEYSNLYCQSDDGELVIIDSERKQQLINPYLLSGKYYLIGLFSDHYGSAYEWIDGLTDVNFTNWAPNEPSPHPGYGQECAIMDDSLVSGDFKWSAYDCKYSDGIICEITGFDPSMPDL